MGRGSDSRTVDRGSTELAISVSHWQQYCTSPRMIASICAWISKFVLLVCKLNQIDSPGQHKPPPPTTQSIIHPAGYLLYSTVSRLLGLTRRTSSLFGQAMVSVGDGFQNVAWLYITRVRVRWLTSIYAMQLICHNYCWNWWPGTPKWHIHTHTLPACHHDQVKPFC